MRCVSTAEQKERLEMTHKETLKLQRNSILPLMHLIVKCDTNDEGERKNTFMKKKRNE